MTTLFIRKLYNSFCPVDEATVKLMDEIPINKEFLVEIKELTKKDLRSTCQNRLYWEWTSAASSTDINEHAGSTKEEWHFYFKKKFLVPIFERDDLGYAAMLVALRKVYKQGMKGECDVLLNHIVQETSTTDCSILQFSEYLNEIELFLHSLGITLKTDPKIYATAMGKK